MPVSHESLYALFVLFDMTLNHSPSDDYKLSQIQISETLSVPFGYNFSAKPKTDLKGQTEVSSIFVVFSWRRKC
jgi:hypothetical protein